MVDTYVIELYNIWVSDFLQNGDLSVNAFQVSMILDLFLL